VRVLVTSTAGAGHFHPLLPFVDALARRGDDVLLVVPPELEAAAVATGQPVRMGGTPPADELAAIWDRVPAASPEKAAYLVNREIFGRLNTAAMLPAVEGACREWRPDLVLHEPCEYASAVAAERLRIPHAQVAISLAGIEAPVLATHAVSALLVYGAGIADAIHASPYVTRFPASLDPSPFPDTRRFRESVAGPRSPLPDWWDGDDAPLVYVTFGSVTGGMPIAAAAYGAALEAVTGLGVRVLLTVGHGTAVPSLGALPGNVHVEAWVPQADVLGDAAAVVCHGGSGTTFGALSAGVPLVMVPLFADQPVNAKCVAAAGAGLLVEPDPGASVVDKIGPAHARLIRAAIESVLADASYRRAAGRVADEMRDLPGIDDVVGGLAAHRLGQIPFTG
jgi:UDP:flavonoid glycosyltransferase YjiC (YdhE family)